MFVEYRVGYFEEDYFYWETVASNNRTRGCTTSGGILLQTARLSKDEKIYQACIYTQLEFIILFLLSKDKDLSKL